MPSTDPVADMLAILKNAKGRRHPKAPVPHSRLKEGVARVLQAEGYLTDVQVVADDPKRPWKKTMWMFLKYDAEHRPVMTDIKRISTPGRRIYRGRDEIGRVLDGLGVTVLSTSRGVLSDRQARRQNVGGELLCKVW